MTKRMQPKLEHWKCHCQQQQWKLVVFCACVVPSSSESWMRSRDGQVRECIPPHSFAHRHHANLAQAKRNQSETKMMMMRRRRRTKKKRNRMRSWW